MYSYTETDVEQFSATKQGSDSFSLTELGCYSSGSYALDSIVYQENGPSTYQATLTVTTSQSGTGIQSGVQSFSGNNHSLGNSSSDSFQFSNLGTLSYGESATSHETLSESGSYGGGSFNLGSVNYSNDGSGGYSLTQTATQTQTGTATGSDQHSGTDSYGVSGSLADGGTTTQEGPYTATSIATNTDAESGNFTMTQLGGYGNGETGRCRVTTSAKRFPAPSRSSRQARSRRAVIRRRPGPGARTTAMPWGSPQRTRPAPPTLRPRRRRPRRPSASRTSAAVTRAVRAAIPSP